MILFLVLINVMVLVFIIGIVLFVFQYRKRKLLYEKEKEETAKQHRLDLLNIQLQIQQHTMQFIGQEIHDSVAQKLATNALPTPSATGTSMPSRRNVTSRQALVKNGAAE